MYGVSGQGTPPERDGDPGRRGEHGDVRRRPAGACEQAEAGPVVGELCVGLVAALDRQGRLPVGAGETGLRTAVHPLRFQGDGQGAVRAGTGSGAAPPVVRREEARQRCLDARHGHRPGHPDPTPRRPGPRRLLDGGRTDTGPDGARRLENGLAVVCCHEGASSARTTLTAGPAGRRLTAWSGRVEGGGSP